MTFRTLAAVLAAAFLVADPASAETLPGMFRSGVEALQAGRAADAAKTLRDLHERYGVTSPDLLVNLGAAEYEAGNHGRALLYLHRAVETAPETPAAEAARVGIGRIRSAMNQEGGRSEGKGFVFGGIADAWTVAFGWADPAVAGSVFLALWAAGFLAAAAWRLARGGVLPVRARSPAGMTAALLLAAALAAGGIAYGAAKVASYRVAVVTADEAPLYDAIDSMERSLTLPEGAEVRHLESRGGFVRVRLSSGKEGWVPEAAVGVP
ncbi:MAG: hypothetical protein FJ087_12530 [Deltaproteobacteria bacterium]|nr:hypothetical protein [Deltaproteobacteria bacterium]